MKILAIDTSTEACSAALLIGDELIERYMIASRKHIEFLKPMVEEVIKEAEIDLKDLSGLAFGVGPGGFAGLRVACAFTQGLGVGLSLPVVPVSTLKAMAQQLLDNNPNKTVLVMLDAKMKEVYWGVYRLEHNEIITVVDDQVSSINEVPEFSEINNVNLIGAGNGWEVAPIWEEVLKPEFIEKDVYPRAGEIALLSIKDFDEGLALDAELISPTYLRNNIALTVEEQRAIKKH